MATSTSMQQAVPRSKHGPMPNPLLSVMSWELRRRLMGYSLWITALLLFLCTLMFMWLGQFKAFMDQKAGVAVAGTTPYGLMFELPGVLMLWFAVLVPFIAADLASFDVKRRTHEVLMASALSSRAYIWGRYLAGLCIFLFLSLLLLLAIIVMAFALHSFLWLGLDPGDLVDYPVPNVGAIILIWAIVVLPAVLLSASISYLVGTLFPVATTAIKVLVIFCWLAAWLFGATLSSNIWLAPFDPTSNSMNQAYTPFYMAQYLARAQHVPLTLRTAIGYSVQQIVPDLWPWIVVHTGYILLSIALVFVTLRQFRRFHNAV